MGSPTTSGPQSLELPNRCIGALGPAELPGGLPGLRAAGNQARSSGRFLFEGGPQPKDWDWVSTSPKEKTPSVPSNVMPFFVVFFLGCHGGCGHCQLRSKCPRTMVSMVSEYCRISSIHSMCSCVCFFVCMSSPVAPASLPKAPTLDLGPTRSGFDCRYFPAFFSPHATHETLTCQGISWGDPFGGCLSQLGESRWHQSPIWFESPPLTKAKDTFSPWCSLKGESHNALLALAPAT